MNGLSAQILTIIFISKNLADSIYLKRYRKDYRVNVVREEIMAWDVGRNYACNLGIDIDKKNWEKYRVDSLLRYISWAYNPSEYKSHD